MVQNGPPPIQADDRWQIVRLAGVVPRRADQEEEHRMGQVVVVVDVVTEDDGLLIRCKDCGTMFSPSNLSRLARSHSLALLEAHSGVEPARVHPETNVEQSF
jgi:hypothetical protein